MGYPIVPRLKEGTVYVDLIPAGDLRVSAPNQRRLAIIFRLAALCDSGDPFLNLRMAHSAITVT
jgi:hypothetical protein